MSWDFWEEADVRLIALVLAIASLAAGLWLPFWALLLITLIVVIIKSILTREAKRAPAEGGIGYYYVAIGLILTILVPMWFMYIVRLIF